MNSQLASSKALGFGVLAIALWMFFITHSGLVSPMAVDPGVMHAVVITAALGLLISGIVAFLRNEGWLAFFFLLWAGLIWGAALAGSHHGGSLYNAWFAIALALVNLYLWLAVCKGGKVGGAVSFTVLLLWISWLLIGLGIFCNVWVLGRIGGVFGLASAVVAFYVSGGTLARAHCANMALPGIPKSNGD